MNFQNCLSYVLTYESIQRQDSLSLLVWFMLPLFIMANTNFQ